MGDAFCLNQLQHEKKDSVKYYISVLLKNYIGICNALTVFE